MLHQKVRTDAAAKHVFNVKVSKRPEFRNRNRYGDVSPCKYLKKICINLLAALICTKVKYTVFDTSQVVNSLAALICTKVKYTVFDTSQVVNSLAALICTKVKYTVFDTSQVVNSLAAVICTKVKYTVFDTSQVVNSLRLNLMRLYSPADLTVSNLIKNS